MSSLKSRLVDSGTFRSHQPLVPAVPSTYGIAAPQEARAMSAKAQEHYRRAAKIFAPR
jgi:hypothetical protein